MQLGAVAMMDALGFKGIWNREGVKENPERVLDRMLELQEQWSRTTLETATEVRKSLDEAGPVEWSPGKVDATMVALSDTVVVGVSVEHDTPHARSFAVRLAAFVTGKVIQHAVDAEPHLAFRGCIARGAFSMRQNFIMGPAVDEAASAMELANGALVWLAPTANAALDDVPGVPGLLEKYAVPLKVGSFRTRVVSPLYQLDSVERELLRGAILGTFSSDALDVQMKKQNTARFLQHAAYMQGLRERRAADAAALEETESHP
jgi:hypothetical protein